MKSITRKEELILLSILNLKEKAYLIAILGHLSRVTGKKISMTSVHLPLSRLEKQGFISSQFGEATAVRGGRRKKIYSLTKPGLEALYEYKKISDELWESYLKLSAQERSG
jgi:PadR family transcriptional regulator PadR